MTETPQDEKVSNKIKTERQSVFSFRVTTEERLQIERRARSVGLKPTQYVRSLALSDSQEKK